MNLVYLFQNSPEWELEHSIKLVKKHFPTANVYTIGDKPMLKGVEKITHKQKGTNRATRVTSSILHACDLFDEFIIMYHDIFLNQWYDFNERYYRGELSNRYQKNNYQLHVNNTYHFLNYHKKTVYNYECHQPFKINSAKFKELMEIVNWEFHHLPKSLYMNFYEKPTKEIPNLKTNEPSKARLHFELLSCFSSCENINPKIKEMILEACK